MAKDVCCSAEATAISNIYSKVTSRVNQWISESEEDELRNNYLAIMKRSKTWKQEILSVAKSLLEPRQFVSDDNDDPSQCLCPADWSLKIHYNNQWVSFDSAQHSAVCIGRMPSCDLVLRSKHPPWRCSRLHAVLFMLPAQRRYVVADVGSYHGIITLWRSDSKRRNRCSMPKSRFLLTFKWDETVVLKLGTEEILIEPLNRVRLAEGEVQQPKQIDAFCKASDAKLPLTLSPINNVMDERSVPLRTPIYSHSEEQAFFYDDFKREPRWLSSTLKNLFKNRSL